MQYLIIAVILISLTSTSSFPTLENSWNIPSSRFSRLDDEGGTVISDSDWIMPSSRTENNLETNATIPLWNVSSIMESVTDEMRNKILMLRTRFINDVGFAISKHDRPEPPGFFDSITLVRAFLESVMEALFRSTTTAREISNSDNTIPLPSYGLVGEIFNDVINTLLNAVTVWFYQDKDLSCPPKLICQANREIFRRGHVIPSLITRLSTYIFTYILNRDYSEELFDAAEMGREGHLDCRNAYPRCEIDL